jgi:hypothetical protein
MNQALFQNFLIFVAVLVGMVLSSPMAILGLFFLKDLPFGLLVKEPEQEPVPEGEYDGGGPMGFTSQPE